MNSPTLSIIIVNWNSQAFVRNCLAAIVNTVGEMPYEILVVDNASFDGCHEMVQELYPAVIFLQSEHNLGFAGANNLAFRRSRGRHILFLNPDTEVQASALEILVSALEHRPEAGMVGAQLLNSDLSLQTTCIAAIPSILNQTLNSDLLRRKTPRWSIWGMRALYAATTEPLPVEAISGACMLGRREVFEQVGAFSTDYFMYAEDMDLSVKVIRAGWKIFYVPEAKIVHHAGGSSSVREENNFSDIVLRESLLHFFRKHRGIAYANLYRASLALVAAIRILLLVLASPALILTSRRLRLSRSLRKWRSIFLWAIGLSRGMRQNHAGQQSQRPRCGPLNTTATALESWVD